MGEGVHYFRSCSVLCLVVGGGLAEGHIQSKLAMERKFNSSVFNTPGRSLRQDEQKPFRKDRLQVQGLSTLFEQAQTYPELQQTQL